MAEGPQRSIPIESLPLEKLQQVRSQLQQEAEGLAGSLKQLVAVLDRYKQSRSALNSLSPASKEKELLLPLTETMYVLGNIEDSETVMVDIGTGFYAEKSIPDAQEHFDRKIKMVTGKVDELRGEVEAKQRQVQSVVMVMQQKIALMAQQSQ